MIEQIFLILGDLGTSIAAHPAWLAFIGGLLAGELVILTLGFLAAQDHFSIWIIFIFFWIGEVVADWIYYELGRLKIVTALKDKKRLSKGFNRLDKFISEISKESVFLTILYSKLIYGTRTFTVIYLGVKKCSRKEFIISEIIIMFFVTAVLSAIGWSAGKGYTLFMDNFKNFQIALTGITILIIILWLVQKQINKQLVKNKAEIKKWVKKK